MWLAVLITVAFFAVIAFAPQQALQILLVLAWGFMLLSTLYPIGAWLVSLFG